MGARSPVKKLCDSSSCVRAERRFKGAREPVKLLLPRKSHRRRGEAAYMHISVFMVTP
jgi:hypothetical protein